MIIRECDLKYYDDELKHFGVPGMKWGHKKATIKSMSSGQRKQAKADFKSNMSKAKADFKSQRKSYAKNQAFSKKAAKFVLGGPTGMYTYNSLRSTGNSRASAAGKTIASALIAGPIGNIALAKMNSSNYKNKKIYGEKAVKQTLSSIASDGGKNILKKQVG